MLGNASIKHKSLVGPHAVDPANNPFLELPGTVHAQYRRNGSKLAGPYWFRFWRENGKLRKAYVKPSEVETVRKLCNARQERRRARLQGLATLKADRANTRDIIREVRLFDEIFRLLEILERKDEDKLTPLQRQRVQRVFAAAGIEL